MSSILNQSLSQKELLIIWAFLTLNNLKANEARAGITFSPHFGKIVVGKFIKGIPKAGNMSHDNFETGNYLQKKFVKMILLRNPFTYQKLPKLFPKRRKMKI